MFNIKEIEFLLNQGKKQEALDILENDGCLMATIIDADLTTPDVIMLLAEQHENANPRKTAYDRQA